VIGHEGRLVAMCHDVSIDQAACSAPPVKVEAELVVGQIGGRATEVVGDSCDLIGTQRA